MNATLLRPLPFGDPDRLVMLSESHPESGQNRVGVLPGSFLDWRERSRSFDGISLFWTAPALVTNRDEPARVTPGEDALGESVTVGDDSRVAGRTVVGVVRDARDLAPDNAPQPTVYVPFAESPDLGVALLARHGASGPPQASNLRARLRIT